MAETLINTKLKKDDEVVIIAGSQKGKRGKILQIDRKSGKVFVQGVNLKKRFQRPTQENPQGGSIEIEFPLPISNVMYYDSKAKKGVKLGVKRDASGKRVRFLKSDGKEI